MFCLVAVVGQCAGVITILSLIWWSGQLNSLIILADNSLGIVLSLISYFWARRGFYQRGSWLLVSTVLLLIISDYALLGTRTPFPMAFIVPIILCTVLLETSETLLITVFSLLFSVSMYLAQNLLQIYHPPLVFNEEIEGFISLAVIVIVIPVSSILLLWPIKNLIDFIQTQSKYLQNEVRERQQAEEELRQSRDQLNCRFIGVN